MTTNPCPRCGATRESLEARCEECGWSPDEIDHSPAGAPANAADARQAAQQSKFVACITPIISVYFFAIYYFSIWWEFSPVPWYVGGGALFGVIIAAGLIHLGKQR